MFKFESAFYSFLKYPQSLLHMQIRHVQSGEWIGLFSEKQPQNFL